MGIAKISFTGSTAVGRTVQSAAANSNLKKCTLEMGGKSAAILFKDADMQNVLGSLSFGFCSTPASFARRPRGYSYKRISPKSLCPAKGLL